MSGWKMRVTAWMVRRMSWGAFLRTWAIVAATDGFATAVYETLFVRRPDLRQVFKNRNGPMGTKVEETLRDIVASINDPDTLFPILTRLGEVHARLKTPPPPKDYRDLYIAICATARERCGASWSLLAELQWWLSLRMVGGLIQRAQREAIARAKA